jgi:hypothetical protein
MTGGFDPRGGANHCHQATVKKSKIHPANFIRVPHSKYSRKPNFSFDHAITMVLAII